MSRQLAPTSFAGAAAALSAAAAARQAVRIAGGGTKMAWGATGPEPDLELRTSGLDRVTEHNHGDFTAILEAGVPLAGAQREFAAVGQMLALDPWLGDERQATIGGIFATGDSGPLRHRYGAPRDLVLGMTVALSDGTIARSGGKVIKNVAGYDLAKLFSGSFGTLGLILSVNVRLHPRPPATATALGASADAGRLAAAARALAAAPLELEALDVAWRDARGGLLAQCTGADPPSRARRAAEAMLAAGLDEVDVEPDDEVLWARQRAGQRSGRHVMLRVAARPSQLEAVLRAVRLAGGALVGRAALGTSYIELEADALRGFRETLPACAVSMVLDDPTRPSCEPWQREPRGPELELMRRLKARFDPERTCNPGIFVGGI